VRGLSEAERELLTCPDFSDQSDWDALESLKARQLVTSGEDSDGVWYYPSADGFLALRLDRGVRDLAECASVDRPSVFVQKPYLPSQICELLKRRLKICG